jgi:hypothetical protein
MNVNVLNLPSPRAFGEVFPGCAPYFWLADWG